jgi:Uma2 family endonuclease
MDALRDDILFTYADYCKWDDGKRWELIDGVAYAMSPAPLQVHQELVLAFGSLINTFLKGKPCKVFIAPFDVRLNAAGDDDDTVVQPDISVVCDSSKLDGKGCNGAPDFIIEILSPSMTKHDKITKFNAYQRAGVREYWIVDPVDGTVAVYILKNGQYNVAMYSDADSAPVSVLEGLTINFAEVFPE